MAIDTTVGEFEYPGEEEDLDTPLGPPRSGWRSDWLRPNVLWAMAGGVVGYLIGHWLGNVIASGYQQVQGSGQNDVAIVLGLSLGVAGWMAGIGALNYPLAKVLGYELSPAPPQQSWVRYFRMTDDHKVVGMQYTVGVLLFLFTGGLLAMLVRTELLSPTNHVFGPGVYIALVGEHGTIMMMMASSAVVGPLGNWLVPLMIGSRRMAFPRVEAFSFWIFMAGYLVILERAVLRRLPDRLDRVRPIADAGLRRDGLLSGRLRGHRDRHDPGRLQHCVHHHQLPRAGHDMEPGAHLRLGRPGDDGTAHPGDADPRGGRAVRDIGPDRTDRLLRERARGQQLLVGEPLLVLRPSRGLHHGAPRFRDRHGDHAGLHPQAPLRLQGGGGRHDRGGAPVLLRVATPSLPERDQPGHAAALHAHHRTHLHPDGVPVPGDARHLVEGENTLRDPDAVLSRDALQLPHRRGHRRLPLRCPGQRHRPRQLLRDGAFPLHDHGRNDLRPFRRASTSGSRRSRARR